MVTKVKRGDTVHSSEAVKMAWLALPVPWSHNIRLIFHRHLILVLNDGKVINGPSVPVVFLLKKSGSTAGSGDLLVVLCRLPQTRMCVRKTYWMVTINQLQPFTLYTALRRISGGNICISSTICVFLQSF